MNSHDKLTVADGGNGILVRWDDRAPNNPRTAAIDLSKGRVTTYDNEMELPCGDGDTPCRGSVEAFSPAGPLVQLSIGGFGVPGGWHAGDAIPPGSSIREDVLRDRKYSAGSIREVLGGHVLSNWSSGEWSSSVKAVHDLKSGELVASTPCRGGRDGQEYPPALSPDGRYVVWSTVAMDLEQGKAYCFVKEAEEPVHLMSVADGIAYGDYWPNEESGRVPVSVTLDTGQVEELPKDTELPSLLLPEAGGFSLELADGDGRQFIFHPRR